MDERLSRYRDNSPFIAFLFWLAWIKQKGSPVNPTNQPILPVKPMKMPISVLIAKLVGLYCVVLPHITLAADAKARRESIDPAFQELIAGMPGKKITAVIVNYPPGGKSIPHRHGSAFVVAYVLSGAIHSQIDDGKGRVYRSGEHWTENPGVHHKVSENASFKEPAKLLAIFIADAQHKDLVIWDKR